VTPAAIAALADEVEARIQGGLSPRPLMSVPHILADESAGERGCPLPDCRPQTAQQSGPRSIPGPVRGRAVPLAPTHTCSHRAALGVQPFSLLH
jgi:hypothetical protein